MGMAQVGRTKLTPDDWARGALELLAEGGVAAIAVEPLAARLGATKGSFYWHFSNREALVRAALDRWEQERTEEVIAVAAAVPDPLRRIRQLFTRVIRAAASDPLEVTLMAQASDPRVAPVIRRVSARRLGYLTETFGELGFAPEPARHRALFAYTTYLGHLQLTHTAPTELPSGAADTRYLDLVLAAFTGPAGIGR
jgi:AcrR family transcriptional regulator